MTLPLANPSAPPPPLVLVAMERFVERAASAAILRESGFAVLEASSIESLLLRVRERIVRCVLIDIGLEAADGRGALDACRELRLEPRGPDGLGVIVLSSSTQPHAAALEAGADAFLALPADPAVLVANVRALLRRRVVPAPATATTEPASAGGSESDLLLASLSHKMRGPLNSISAWAQLLRSGRLSVETSQEALAAIVRGVQAETRILDDLLDLSRISSGALRLETRPLTLSAVLTGALDAMDEAAVQKGVALRRPAPSQASVVGDPDRLRQVFSNLLANAIRFTPAGGSIDVEIDERDSEVEVRVHDTGQGIEPELLPRLFERRRASTDAGSAVPGGAGLGLSIVKSLVQRHGGAVRAASDGPGQGATFCVRLPRPNAPAARLMGDRPHEHPGAIDAA